MAVMECPCCGVAGCTTELLMAKADLEKRYPKLKVTSGYRCDQHQANLRQAWVRGKIEWRRLHGGLHYPEPEPSLHSQHSTGKAIDVMCPNAEQPALIALALLCGFRGVGKYNGLLHFDIRDVPFEWCG